jgi:hypothetical protein
MDEEHKIKSEKTNPPQSQSTTFLLASLRLKTSK